ncbi:hypothetical protein [Bradyrhizobium sp. BR 1433]|uniref:hypothetical protein n=1 Tax=Bradyrhizobium sp. BR 1433 TaxID=3447967 RepID=UPI003EE6E1CC
MSASFERLIDGIIDALQSHVVPNSSDDFVRGQVFSAIYALNGLKLAADWKAEPLLEQVRLQDDTFATVERLAGSMAHPEVPSTPRIQGGTSDVAAIEALRDDGDRRLGNFCSGRAGRTYGRLMPMPRPRSNACCGGRFATSSRSSLRRRRSRCCSRSQAANATVARRRTESVASPTTRNCIFAQCSGNH